jgi:hypothetical protein
MNDQSQFKEAIFVGCFGVRMYEGGQKLKRFDMISPIKLRILIAVLHVVLPLHVHENGG